MKVIGNVIMPFLSEAIPFSLQQVGRVPLDGGVYGLFRYSRERQAYECRYICGAEILRRKMLQHFGEEELNGEITHFFYEVIFSASTRRNREFQLVREFGMAPSILASPKEGSGGWREGTTRATSGGIRFKTG